jgi:hypothetical protein
MVHGAYYALAIEVHTGGCRCEFAASAIGKQKPRHCAGASAHNWSINHLGCGCGLVPAGFAGIGAGLACPVVAGDVIGRVAWPVVVAGGLVAVFVFVPAKPKIRNRTTTIATAPAIHPQDDP